MLGKHEVMCEFAGEPKLAELHTAVHKALCELDQETFPTFRMKMMPEGLLLSDDSSVAALSSGSTIEVIPVDRAMARRILEESVNLADNTPHVQRAVERGDTETVRLMILAWGDSWGRPLITSALRTAVVNGDLPMCKIMFASGKCIPLMQFSWNPANSDIMSLAMARGADVHAGIDHSGGRTRLMDACKYGELPLVPLLLDHGAKLNAQDSNGKTALMYMCKQGDCPTVSLLLDRGAELETWDDNGRTALWYADTKEVLLLLVQRGAALDVYDNDGGPFLHSLMFKSNQLEAFVALPDVDVNVRDRITGGTALIEAALVNEDIAPLLAHADIDVGVQDNDGMTCLMHAASAKNVTACEEILAYLKANHRTADVTLKDSKGWTCLMHALYDSKGIVFGLDEEDKRSAQLVVTLTSQGADPSLRANDGLTALHMTVANKSYIAFAALLAAGACPNTCDSEGVPLLHTLVPKPVFPFRTLVASPGIDLNVCDSKGRTALMRVACSNRIKCKALLEKGADVSAQDNDGWTCLGHAAATGDVKVVTLLLDHGAGINDGAVPPLLAAVNATSAPVCRLLLERGADVTKPAADGRTCVSVAAGLSCRGAKAVQALVHEALDGGDGDDDSDSTEAEPEAETAQGAVGETPGSGSSKRKREDDEEDPAGSTHACAVCGAVALASGESFPSAESVLRHASSKHRMRRSEYTRRFGEE